MKGLVLVGFMGTGKTVVGRELSLQLGWPLADIDEWIVQQAGKPITQIFSEDGESAFRTWETRALETLAQSPAAQIISTGGGIVITERNWPLLRALGPVVCLTADIAEIIQRVGRAQDRPLLAGEPEDVSARVEKLLAQREAAYNLADWKCPTDHTSPADIAARIIQRFKLNL